MVDTLDGKHRGEFMSYREWKDDLLAVVLGVWLALLVISWGCGPPPSRVMAAPTEPTPLAWLSTHHQLEDVSQRVRSIRIEMLKDNSSWLIELEFLDGNSHRRKESVTGATFDKVVDTAWLELKKYPQYRAESPKFLPPSYDFHGNKRSP